jgi:hypothetical protein
MVNTTPVAPQSLTGASEGSFALPKGGEVIIQASLIDHQSAFVHFRLDDASGGADTDLTTATCMLGHGGDVKIPLPPSGMYLYWYLTDAAGAALSGTANDHLLIDWRL